MEKFGPFAVTNNSDIRNNNEGLQDVPSSELCPPAFPHQDKKRFEHAVGFPAL